MPRFDVNFVDPKTFFYPGETIEGNILIKLDSAIRCKKISLEFKGKSYVYWTDPTEDETTSFESTEEYFEDSVTLLAPLPPEKEIILNPGVYNYPFQFRLPNNLPPSVDHAPINMGYIRYYMKIKIDVDSRARRWRLKSNFEKKIPFQVISYPVNFNRTRGLLQPATATKEKFLCCLCCQSGPIRLVGRIQKQAYHLGDQIIFSFKLDNKETDKPIRMIGARLIGHFTFISDCGRTKETQKVMSRLKFSEGLPPRSEDSWNDVAFIIPTNITPSFDNCRCMRLQYCLGINVHITAALDSMVLLPITISSRPHTVQTVQPMVQPGLILGNDMPSAPSMVSPPPASGAAMPPTASPLPSTDHTPTTGCPSAGYLPGPITQQPAVWNPDIPPPAYPAEVLDSFSTF